MKNPLTLWQIRILVPLFFGLIALASMAPLASNTQIVAGNDLPNHLGAIVQAKMALLEGQFPLRIAPYAHDGMRYPLFQFYAPSGYTLAGLIHLLITPNNPYVAYKLTLWLALVIGAIFTYRIANRLEGIRAIGLLAGVFYLTTPYLLMLISRVSAFNEIIAFAISTLIIFYNFTYFHDNTRISALLLSAIAWYLLATTHIVTFFYFSCFFGAFVLLLSFRHRTPTLFCRFIIPYLLGCLLAAWFLIPIALYEPWLNIANEIPSPMRYTLFTPLAALLTAHSTSPQPLPGDFLPIKSLLNPAFGWPALLTVGACTYLWFKRFTTQQFTPTTQPVSSQKTFFYLSNHDPLPPFLFPLLLLFFISFFLIWSPIDLWQHLPSYFSIGQFCWRLFSQSFWITTLLFIWGIAYLFDWRLDTRHVAVGILLLGISTSSWMVNTKLYPRTPQEVLRDPLLGTATPVYLFNPKNMPLYTYFIDHFTLEKTDPDKKNLIFILPMQLIKETTHPYITIPFNLPPDMPINAYTLNALLNNKIISSISLKPGAFNWHFSLPMTTLIKEKKLSFKFIAKPHTTPLPFQIIIAPQLSGFMHAPETLSIDQVSPYCTQQNTTKKCILDVSSKTRLLALPVLYYPALFNIQINNQPVTYMPILNGSSLATGVAPIPGIRNIITVRFTGLPWANRISQLGWSIAFLLLLKIIFDFIRTKKT